MATLACHLFHIINFRNVKTDMKPISLLAKKISEKKFNRPASSYLRTDVIRNILLLSRLHVLKGKELASQTSVKVAFERKCVIKVLRITAVQNYKPF